MRGGMERKGRERRERKGQEDREKSGGKGGEGDEGRERIRGEWEGRGGMKREEKVERGVERKGGKKGGEKGTRKKVGYFRTAGSGTFCDMVCLQYPHDPVWCLMQYW